MTQVIFDVVDLVGEVHPGDTVSVWPPYVTSTVDGRVRSTRKIDVLVDKGPVTEDIEPGPLVVQLQCRGIADAKPRTVTIPDEGTITLANLLQGTFTYTPAVMSQVSLDAQRAEDAAVRAEGVADSTHWQDDRLSVMGQLGPSLKGPKGDKGDKGDSGDGAGDVLWSELNPVLDGKLDSSEASHWVGEVSYGKVVRREPNSENIRTGNPTQTYHATPKQYVDGRTPEIRVVSSLPSSPLPGVVYLVTG